MDDIAILSYQVPICVVHRQLRHNHQEISFKGMRGIAEMTFTRHTAHDTRRFEDYVAARKSRNM